MYNFSYCLNCGGEFNKVTERFYKCPKCDLNYYIGINSGAGIILQNSANQILLIKRSYNPSKGKWSIPAGFLEFGENSEQGAKREVFEEVGLKINELEYWGSYPGIYQHKNIDYHTLLTVFIAKIPDEYNIKLSDESTEYAFFDIDKIPLADTGNQDVVNALTDLMNKK